MAKIFSEQRLISSACDVKDAFSCWQTVDSLWPLSPWIMRQEYLASALSCPISQSCPQRRRQIETAVHNYTALLARDKGSCYVLFAVTNSDALSKIPYLRPSFALPFIWKQGTAASTLPAQLQQMTDDIVAHIAPDQQWHLAWNFSEAHSECTFALDLKYDSGWATLAASLLLASEGGMPDPTIWATAAWDKVRGPQEVDSVAEKLETVYDLGGRKLFVAYANKDSANQQSKQIAARRQCKQVDIDTFSFEPAPAKALQPYLIHFYYPPDNSQPLEVRCSYYNYMNARQEGKKLTFDYYSKYLADGLAAQCRAQGIRNLSESELQKLQNLVTFVSQNPTALLILSLIPLKRVLLFFTEETARELPKFEAIAKAKNIALETVKLTLEDPEPDEDSAIYLATRKFIAQHGAECTAVDVTPGTKNFSVIASWAIDPRMTPCLYIGHSWGKQAFAAGKERIRRLLPMGEK